MLKNKLNWFEFTSKNLRKSNLYECHSIDNNPKWINECKKNAPNYLLDNILFFHNANVITSEFLGRACTFFDPIPNICPDLIYLDAPDQFSSIGHLRGLSTNHPDRMPMAADILSFEHFLQPGALIIVDGRTANSRFLKCNLQRDWAYYFSEEWDQHFFELQEKPLGIYNKMFIDHTLGSSFYKRISNY